METINSVEEIATLKKNKVLGNPKLESTKISFHGENNVLYVEEGVTISGSTIEFKGDNSIVFLGASREPYKIGVSVNHNCVCHFGRDNYFNGKMYVIVSEETTVFFGDGGLYSTGIWIRTADPHLIYDCTSHMRINDSKGIYVGDHVWLGQDVTLTKGTQISSGSIMAAKACVSGKNIPSNTIWGGVPATQIKDNVFWKGDCVHAWVKKDTDEHAIDNSDTFIYEYNEEEYLPFDKLDRRIQGNQDTSCRINLLKELHQNKTKNRFVSPNTAAKNGKKKRGGIRRKDNK